MKKILHILGLTMIFAPGALQAQSAREALKAGSREFADGAYDKAAAHFEEAASLAPKQKLDPAIAHYNRGNALYKMQDFAGARACYENALRTLDTDLQSTIYFNLGNLTFHSATNMTSFDQHVAVLDQSMDYYMRSVFLHPDSRNAKVNYEMLYRMKNEMLVARDTLYKVLQAAKKQVRDGRLEVAMEDCKQFMSDAEVQRALSLIPEAQKDYQELLQKLQELIDVVEKAKGMTAELKAQQEALDSLQQEAEHEAD
ncbi:MAG TPA: tetratricopeptide repeat protein [Kiritimatiellia bacterium]|nr:tetratricopeptide repeat protein [Kiritimatiellia bacterium]HNS81577.1 tetratricopeptide repeat protein [Kiritimatiellia bacterium]